MTPRDLQRGAEDDDGGFFAVSAAGIHARHWVAGRTPAHFRA